jgi:hypothetical protein
VRHSLNRNADNNQLQRQFPQSARRPNLIVIRAGGCRGKGTCWTQARAFSVEADGSARLLSLSHRSGAGSFFNPRRHFSNGERRVA